MKHKGRCAPVTIHCRRNQNCQRHPWTACLGRGRSAAIPYSPLNHRLRLGSGHQPRWELLATACYDKTARTMISRGTDSRWEFRWNTMVPVSLPLSSAPMASGGHHPVRLEAPRLWRTGGCGSVGRPMRHDGTVLKAIFIEQHQGTFDRVRMVPLIFGM